MNDRERNMVRHVLRKIAEAHAAAMSVLEQKITALSSELALDPSAFWTGPIVLEKPESSDLPFVDHSTLSVSFKGKLCFLGNTLTFKLFERLARRPNSYVSHDDLRSTVWNGIRSDSTIRSVVKTLRAKLRQAQMEELAEAIDGSVRRHYALRLVSK